jgi:hypothetical protein
MSDEINRKKDQAKQLLLQARIYRWIALAMGFAGVCIFGFVYFDSIQGHVLEALMDPGTIGVVLIPFVPAVVFIYMAGGVEAKLDDVIAELEQLTAAEGGAPRPPKSEGSDEA